MKNRELRRTLGATRRDTHYKSPKPITRISQPLHTMFESELLELQKYYRQKGNTAGLALIAPEIELRRTETEKIAEIANRPPFDNEQDNTKVVCKKCNKHHFFGYRQKPGNTNKQATSCCPNCRAGKYELLANWNK